MDNWEKFQETNLSAKDAFYNKLNMEGISDQQSCRVVPIITTAQLHSTKLELKFCAGSNSARGVSGIRDGEDF